MDVKIKMLLLTVVLLLGGCIDDLDGYMVRQAVDICKEHGGRHHLKLSGIDWVICNDGAAKKLIGHTNVN